MRTILHSDLNNFYASVACLQNPSLREVPMAVCGDPRERHGIVLSKNEKAKAAGVKTAEAIWQAKEKCPDLITVGVDFSACLRLAARAREIYREYSDRVEPFGLDEAWLDISDLGVDGRAAADELRARIRRELGLTVSVGVSFNKVFAKLASDLKKPDATTCVTPENFRDVVWPLPADALLYVGPATRRKLLSRNIRTIGDIAARQPQTLRAMLGKHGETLWRYANGLESAPVAPWGAVTEIKSIGNSITPARDLVSDADARELLAVLCPCVAERLLRHGLEGRVVTVSIRDDALKTISVQQTLPAPTALSGEIEGAARRLFFQHWNWTRRVRSLGVCVSGLSMQGASGQLSMWEDARDRALALDRTLLALRRRYGRECVRRALLLNSDFGRLRPHEDLPAFVRSHSPQGA
ncbi:MAG TPA: DNA polymerase IV [Candidatus Pullichristensenella avicola]|nr:DNA polymerase IV [Candidatus Pullichristensenella avicola]